MAGATELSLRARQAPEAGSAETFNNYSSQVTNMATPKQAAFRLSEDSQQRLIQFYAQCRGILNQQFNIREGLLASDRAYMREVDNTEEQYKARMANKRGDPTKFQNQIIPVVMPQVESATTYQTSVFCTGQPMFGVVAPPEFADEAVMLESILGEQQIRGRWPAEIIKAFRNGFKYNLAAVECDWIQEVTYSLETDQTKGPNGVPTEILWQGNKIKNLDMYNTFWDTRCSPDEVAEFGEFAGYTEIYSRIRLKKFINSLPVKSNVKEAFESGDGAPVGWVTSDGYDDYYIPFLNPNSIVDPNNMASTNWLAWAGMENASSTSIRYSNMYKVTTLYARILPDDFKMLGAVAPKTPQVWKLIIVNNKVVVYAERLTNAHGLIPIFFMQPLNDGLGYQTKSFADNIVGIQEITSALANSSIHARRRAVSDRMLYDPSRVSPGAINNEAANAKIPVRPSAYQDDLSKAIYPIPFNDNQFQFNQAEMNQFLTLANQISGLNPVRQGQFQKGNKTRTEFTDTMNYANGRDETIAISLEGTFFTPLKEVLKLNILQYQPGVSIFNPEQGSLVTVDPIRLRQANVVFKVSDGRVPSDKLIDGESMSLAMQTIASVPALAQAYNIAPLFSYLMKMRGAKLGPFEKTAEQLAYEQALATWQQAAMQIATAVQEAAKEAEPPMSPEQLQEFVNSLTRQNPMPQPEQYGFDPAKPQLSKEAVTTPNNASILDSMSNTINNAAQQSQAATGAAAPQTNGTEQ
jgi:hypothetical protein